MAQESGDFQAAVKVLQVRRGSAAGQCPVLTAAAWQLSHRITAPAGSSPDYLHFWQAHAQLQQPSFLVAAVIA